MLNKDEFREQFTKLYKNNQIKNVARELSLMVGKVVSEQTVSYYAKKYGLRKRRKYNRIQFGG
jgi:hypothetical protein